MTLLSPPSSWMSLCAYACAAASYAPSLSDSDRGQVAAALVVGPPLFNSIEFDFSKKMPGYLTELVVTFLKENKCWGRSSQLLVRRGGGLTGPLWGPPPKKKQLLAYAFKREDRWYIFQQL